MSPYLIPPPSASGRDLALLCDGSVIGIGASLLDRSDILQRLSPLISGLAILSVVASFAASLANTGLLAAFAMGREDIPFARVSVALGAFVLLCGTGHLLVAINYWLPEHRIGGQWHLLTAILSTVLCFRLLTQTLKSPSLANMNTQLKHEVGKRRALEKALIQSRILQEAILNAATETAIIACDLDGIITVFNRGAERMLGYSAADLIGRETPIRFHDAAELEHRARELSEQLGQEVRGFDIFIAVPQRDGIERREWTYVTNDQRQLTVRLTVTCVHDAADVVIGFLGVALDVTEQKSRETELRKLALVASKTHNAVIIADRAGLVEWVNDGFTRLTGYTLDEVRGQKPGRVLQGAGTDLGTRAAIRAAIREGRIWEGEIYNYSKSGRGYWQSLSITPLTDDAGEVTGFISMQMDVSSLREALSRCDQASRAKSQFLTNMSHEIRTPLTAIVGFAEILGETVESPEAVELVQTIQRNGEQLHALIDDILNLSKIESGLLSVQATSTPLLMVLHELVESLRSHAAARGLSLDLQVATGVPESLTTDWTQLKQALANLVDNAIKFTETGSVTVNLRPCDYGAGEGVAIDVIDTGMGIAAEERQRLFLPFQQADGSLTRRHGGAGLGLCLTRKLVHLLGGEVEVDSQPGCGSRFTIRLPNPTDSAEQPSRDVPVTGRNDGSGIAGCRVLLVEDGEDNRKLLELLLHKAGAEVTHAVDGFRALTALVESEETGQSFDIVLMDLQMPGLDGWTTTREFRLRGFNRPILAVTAQALPGDRERCLEAGCNDVVTKPFVSATLFAAMSRVLQLSPLPC